MPVAVDSFVFDRFSQPDTNSVVARHAARAYGEAERECGEAERECGEAEFRARIAAWRNAFDAVDGAAIALYDPDGVDFATALFGAWYANKTVYLPGDTQAETCRSLQLLGVTFVGEFPGHLAPMRAIEPFGAYAVVSTATPSAHDSTNETAPQFGPLDAEAAQVIIFTSGSTGAPQAVPKRLSQLLAEVHTLEKVFGARIGNSDVVATVSHQHIYGLLFKVLWPLVYHRTFFAESLVYPEQLLRVLAAHKATIISGPAHLKRLSDTLDWHSVRHNVAATFSSGGPLPLSASSSVESLLGNAPIEVYGSSETGGVAFRQCAHATEAPWTPLPGVEVTARDHQLSVRSPHLADNDWFLVPDSASFDEEGNFTLLGRVDRIAKIEGKRVSLAGIEEALIRSGFVAEARVIQLESSRDELGALVVPNDAGWDVLREEQARGLRARLDATLADSVERLAHPRRWRWVDSLPLNAVGKTSHAATLALFATYGVPLPAVHLVHSSPNEASIELHVSPHLAVFDGHFRKLPVLAGVVQLDWAILLARKQFGLTTNFARMEAIKFVRVYQPGLMLRLNMLWNAERHLLTFRFESGTSTHSSGRIFFKA